jgi:1-acyl-sn-glycerol-3-phosphate acyltransferase
MPMTSAPLLAGTGATSSRAVAAVVRGIRASLRLGLFVAGLLLAFVAVVSGRALLSLAPRAAGERFGLEMIHLFTRFGAWVFGVRVLSTGPLPHPGSLIVANHRSYLDAVALASVVHTTFLAKREVASWPIIGVGARLAGVVFVDRADTVSRGVAGDELVSRVERGTTVVNFPEGTTTRAPAPLPFHPGLFRRVAGRDVAVVPVRIDYDDDDACWTGDDAFVPHLLRLAARGRTVARLRFSPPLAARTASSEELSARSRELVTPPV